MSNYKLCDAVEQGICDAKGHACKCFYCNESSGSICNTARLNICPLYGCSKHEPVKIDFLPEDCIDQCDKAQCCALCLSKCRNACSDITCENHGGWVYPSCGDHSYIKDIAEASGHNNE